MFVEALSAAAALYENRSLLVRLQGKLVQLVTKGRRRYLIVGAGGVGKTTLGHLLSDRDDPSEVGAYNVSMVPEEHGMQAIVAGKLFVVPGQERRRVVHGGQSMRRLQAGAIDGIIHVVANGWHTPEFQKIEQHPAFLATPKGKDFLAVYQAWCKEEELRVLEDLAPHLSNAPEGKRTWLRTLVTKQDLWWSDRESVRSYYTDPAGQYAAKVASIRKAIGERMFDHDVISCCLEAVNLSTKSDGPLLSTTGGYDEPLRIANLTEVLNHLHQLFES